MKDPSTTSQLQPPSRVPLGAVYTTTGIPSLLRDSDRASFRSMSAHLSTNSITDGLNTYQLLALYSPLCCILTYIRLPTLSSFIRLHYLEYLIRLFSVNSVEFKLKFFISIEFANTNKIEILNRTWAVIG